MRKEERAEREGGERRRGRLSASRQTRISGSRTTSHGGPFDLTWPTYPLILPPPSFLDQRTPAAFPALLFSAFASSGFYPGPAQLKRQPTLPLRLLTLEDPTILAFSKSTSASWRRPRWIHSVLLLLRIPSRVQFVSARRMRFWIPAILRGAW